jgi:hypothetical protein
MSAAGLTDHVSSVTNYMQRALIEKLTVACLLKKFQTIDGNRRFITVVIGPYTGSCPVSHESSADTPIQFIMYFHLSVGIPFLQSSYQNLA